MAEDAVYKAFVLPFYQEARKTAVAEKLRADQAEAEAARSAEQFPGRCLQKNCQRPENLALSR
jgi:hypothetical protein